jgi:UDP-N-acetylglucosamine 2-epimerase (non-hydrolysing)
MAETTVAVVVGTRPEAIKMAPVFRCLRAAAPGIRPVLLSTGHHRQMLQQVLGVFGLTPDVDLDVMTNNQSLSSLAALIMTKMEQTLAELSPDLLLVQGDTTSVFASALAAANLDIPVGHVEAGLRSHDKQNPFPEEINRRLTGVLTDLHFAPTTRAADALRAEGVNESAIAVTGNTVIDALLQIAQTDSAPAQRTLGAVAQAGERMILLTSHRREAWGRELENICGAVREIVDRFPDVVVVYPVHLNPNVRGTVLGALGGQPRILLIDPVDYVTFVRLMQAAHLVLTDSGGVQEEAPTFHKPVLVLRKTTERPEAARAGLARIIGTDRVNIVRETARLLEDGAAYRAMSHGANPFGDGFAADRIVRAIRRWSEGRAPLLEPAHQFVPAQPAASALAAH